MDKDNRAQMTGMRQLCREIFGTENPDELRKIAAKAKEYDRIMKKELPMNVRGAGRKGMFDQVDVDCLIEMYHEGKSVTFLAEHFHISRPTVYKYLESEMRFRKDPFITMRMIFMYKEIECTVIDVDFRHEKIYIRNKTNDILHRAFGVLEEPTWEDFEDFLRSRCFPETRANLKWILRELDIPYYDPIQIIERTEGRMAEDLQWIRIQYREEVLARWN